MWSWKSDMGKINRCETYSGNFLNTNGWKLKQINGNIWLTRRRLCENDVKHSVEQSAHSKSIAEDAKIKFEKGQTLMQTMLKKTMQRFQIKCFNLFRFFCFSVDMADAAIRHENGKQVARWNVDPNYSGPETPTSSLGYALSAGHHPFLSNHAPHPNSISANRTQAYTTGQLTRHPNG